MPAKRILIVDDQPAVAATVGLFLEMRHNDLEVRIENRSEHALAAARCFHPDILLLDIDMPVMTGIELAAAVKSDPELCHTPILFLSGCLQERDCGTKMIEGFPATFLSRLVEPELLERVIERTLAEAS